MCKWLQVSHEIKPSTKISILFPAITSEHNLEKSLKMSSINNINNSQRIPNKKCPHFKPIIQNFKNSLNFLDCIIIFLFILVNLTINLTMYFIEKKPNLNIEVF